MWMLSTTTHREEGGMVASVLFSFCRFISGGTDRSVEDHILAMYSNSTTTTTTSCSGVTIIKGIRCRTAIRYITSKYYSVV